MLHLPIVVNCQRVNLDIRVGYLMDDHDTSGPVCGPLVSLRLVIPPGNVSLQAQLIMGFRPCIDLHAGKVKQIVGSSLTSDSKDLVTNFEATLSAQDYAR